MWNPGVDPGVDPDVEPWSGTVKDLDSICWGVPAPRANLLVKPALHISLRATRQPLFCFWKILCANVFDAGVNMRGLLIQPGQNRRR